MILLKKNDELFQLHKEAICEKLSDEIDKLITKDYQIIDRKKVRIYKATKELLKYIKDNLEYFVVSDFKEQRLLINTISELFPDLTKIYKKSDKRTNNYRIIRYLFETRAYSEFTKHFTYGRTKKEYGAYRFIELINLKTCPYCNRNYISMIQAKNTSEKKRRPELDHFHPKSIYPFLAVNFFNLIPSCSTCNKLKSDDDSSGLLHPYDQKNENITFTYWLNDMKFYDVKSIKDITFESENSIAIEIENLPKSNMHTFQIERLYQEHTDVVIELILKHLHYPQSYINELANFGYNEEEIYRFVFSNYLNEDALIKKPLAKLTRDIARELNLLDFIPEVKDIY